MSYDWKNKVVVITGAATGIGALVVKYLLKESVKHIAILDVAEQAGITYQNELNSKHGKDKVKFYKCDVTNDDQLFSSFDSVRKYQGYIDVLINNAGIMNDSWSMFKKEIEINITALVSGSLKVLETMRKDQGGRGGTIINISSIAGIIKIPYMPIYGATKTAVIQFSNCLGHADYYSKTGVRLLSICFGATDTPLLTSSKLGCYDKDSKELLDGLLPFKMQSPESAARELVEAYKKPADTSSIWLIQNNEPALDITDRVNSMYDAVKDLIY